MDLIYADENKIEIGVIPEYEFDIAFGSDENDFELTLDVSSHCCKAGYYIYIEDTEYGGIVDKIEIDTSAGTVIYTGRSWHGIIEKKVIEPPEGQDYKIVSGEANSILKALIADLSLDDLFTASSMESSINILYQFDRYTPAYTGILKMLLANDGKLQITHKSGKVILEAIPLYDYSNDEEWDSSQLSFSITKDLRPVNHLICLGGGNLKERHVIHLFMDENKGLQPYTMTDDPLSNADYILNKSKQVMEGIDEVSEVYDYSNAQDVFNYILLKTAPANWDKLYPDYYEKNGDDFKKLERQYADVYELLVGEPWDWSFVYPNYYCKDGTGYKQLSQEYTDVFQPLTSQPAEWASYYKNYYYKSGTKYKSVSGVEKTDYKIQKSQPKDWKKNYGDYKYYYSDGVTIEYKSVSGVTKYKYQLQTIQPSDWKTKYKSYFYKEPVYIYYYTEKVFNTGAKKWEKKILPYSQPQEEIKSRTFVRKYLKKEVQSYIYENLSLEKAPKWRTGTYYTKTSYQVAPTWKKNTYYTEVTSIVAPVWKSGMYYQQQSAESVPQWQKNKYYRLNKNVEQIPEWKSNTYYEQRIDNYADLVANGIERLKELNASDSISIQLDATQSYDINDIIGTTENQTGISVYQPITKKIVKIKDHVETVEYKTGG